MIQYGLFGNNKKIRLKKPKRKIFSKKIADVHFCGGGLQSSTLVYMAHKGLIEVPKVVIHADTGDETNKTVLHRMYLAKLCREMGSQFIVPKYRFIGISESIEQGISIGSMPVYVDTGGKRPGMLRRQCSDYSKIQASQNALKAWLVRSGFASVKSREIPEFIYFNQMPPRNYHEGMEMPNYPRILMPSGAYVRCAFGITIDEDWRFNDRGLAWQQTWYPFRDMNYRREDCTRWCEENGYPAAPKSACVQCPYHTDVAWLNMYIEHLNDEKRFGISLSGTDWARACQIDDMLRDPAILGKHPDYGQIKGTMYLHKSCKPLREVGPALLNGFVEEKRTPLEYALKIELLDNSSCGSDGAFTCHS